MEYAGRYHSNFLFKGTVSLVRGMDPDADLAMDPDPSIIMQN
jgi:hypothetical protein